MPAAAPAGAVLPAEAEACSESSTQPPLSHQQPLTQQGQSVQPSAPLSLPSLQLPTSPTGLPPATPASAAATGNQQGSGAAGRDFSGEGKGVRTRTA